MCKENTSSQGFWHRLTFTALCLLSLVWLLFPVGLDSAWYMDLVPRGVQLLLVGFFLPMLALLCRIRTGEPAAELLTRSSPRMGAALYKTAAFFLGPLGLMPLTAFLTGQLWCALLGLEGIWPAITGAALPLLAVGILTVVFRRRSFRRALPFLAGIAFLLLAAGALAALAGDRLPSPDAADPVFLSADLDCHVGYMLFLAPAILGPLSDAKDCKNPLKSRLFRPALLGFLCAAAAAALWFLLAARSSGCRGMTPAALSVGAASSRGVKLLTGLGLLSASTAILAGGLTISLQNPTQENGSVSLPRTAAALAAAFILSLPPVAAIWSKVSSAILLGFYPILAVTAIFYALVPGCFQPRKQCSLRPAFRAALIFGVVMAVYRLTVSFNLDLFLFQGLYESLLMAKNHMTWLPLAALFFVYGDMRYRQKQDAPPKRASGSR